MIEEVLVYSTLMVSIMQSRIPYRPRISNILERSIESKALLKSAKINTASLLQLVISSIILRRARIWPKVERPALNPF